MRELLCSALGHNDKCHEGPERWHRSRYRRSFYWRCERCHMSDSYPLEALGLAWIAANWRMWRYELLRKLKTWWRRDCDDCHRVACRFGRPVGDHRKCVELPF